MTGAAVTLSHVSKIYEGTGPDGPSAVDGLSLEVKSGEFLTILGASGSGKTTTLRMIAGLERPTSGEIQIDGQPVSSASRHLPTHKRKLGMVFQSYAIWPHMTVAENVAFPLKVAGVDRRSRQATAQEMLATVALSEYADRLPSSLSGGQQQRVALARALVGEPRIILYDEPLSNLDAKVRDRLRDQIRSIHDKLGITAVYVTHDQREAMAISDRIALMDSGRLQQVGTADDLYHRPTCRSVAEFIGDVNVLPVKRIHPGAKMAWVSDRMAIRYSPDCMAPENSDKEQVVVVRPHWLRVEPVAGGADEGLENSFTGAVSQVRFLGDRLRVQVNLGEGVSVAAEMLPSSSNSLLVPGSSVQVVLERSHVLVVS